MRNPSAVRQHVETRVPDMIYFDKKRLKQRQCNGGFIWCLHNE